MADTIATGFEIGIVVLALTLALVRVPRRHMLKRVTRLVGVATLSLTALALLSVMAAAAGVIPPAE